MLLSIVKGVPIHIIVARTSKTYLSFSSYNLVAAIGQNIRPSLFVFASIQLIHARPIRREQPRTLFLQQLV